MKQTRAHLRLRLRKGGQYRGMCDAARPRRSSDRAGFRDDGNVTKLAKFDAGEAFRIRLADRVFADDALEAETLAYATQLSELAPGSINIAKAAINALSDHLAARQDRPSLRDHRGRQ